MKECSHTPHKTLSVSIFTQAHLQGGIDEHVLTDICAKGLQFRSGQLLEKGQHIDVQLQERIQNGTYEIRSIVLSGRVVWTKPVEGSAPPAYRTFVEFDFPCSDLERFAPDSKDAA